MGRFAPSPTGPLHIGSLYTALASFLQARAKSGSWFVRVDDLDTFRIVPGSTDSILRTLEIFGLYWDGSLIYQSQRLESYRVILNQLDEQNLIYPCTCTRKFLALHAKQNPTQPLYPGFCRGKIDNHQTDYALRVKTSTDPIRFYDKHQGYVSQDLSKKTGDFIVKRRDRVYAYQLAVVCDDYDQGITEVLRGADLLESTPRQIYLQKLLGFPTPAYRHIPVIVDEQNIKLSKQSHAKPVDESRPVNTLLYLLKLLNQPLPADIEMADLDAIISWAIKNWNPFRLPKSQNISLNL